MTSKLDQLRTMTTIVADTGDMESIRAYQPTDSTTNPTLIFKAAQLPAYSYLFDEAVGWGRKTGASPVAVTERLIIDFGAELTRIVPGRVSTEVDATLSFDVAATERIALGRAVLVNVSLGYGGDDFQFDQTLSGATAALPSVAYRFVRAGADVHVTFLSAFTAFAGGSYLDILDSGYTAQLFPRESVGGVEGHLGASYDLTKRWQASVSAAYTRFFYSVNPVPGDTTVAGGALDEQTRVLAALAYRM